MSKPERVYLFDTTLRDGAQTQGVDFSATDKATIARALDDLGLDYIEAGWPGANPTDDAFFANPPQFKTSRLTAFGMTKKAGVSASNDPSLSGVLNSSAKTFCLVGKTSDFQVKVALGITLDENLENIRETMKAAAAKGEALLDAEHFFDGYKANPDYALSCIRAAHESGARWVVLCDTNGGTLPHEIAAIVAEAAKIVPADHLGIHTHDDTGNAVANSLAAVNAGVRMVQGTLNGLGERCGNANLISLIPTLVLKMGFDVGVDKDDLKKLRPLSRMLDEMLNRAPDTGAPYVGERAFVHKGGLHASAVLKNASSYEHIDPALVGNYRHIAVSDQAGRANILARLDELNIKIDPKDECVGRLVESVKQREAEGYAYDGAAASFEILTRKMLGKVPVYFLLEQFAVTDERIWDAADNKFIVRSRATVTVNVKGEMLSADAEGNGPVNALDRALRRCLEKFYPALKDMHLLDYRVRILKAQEATAALTRVLIESGSIVNPDNKWSTVGVSGNIIEASYGALRDSYIYTLLKAGA